MNPHIFRQYDIRGKVPSELSKETVGAIGRALGTYLKRIDKSTCVVGRDVRLSSADFAAALIKGIRETGCNVTDIGQVPTPILYFATNYLKTDASVMITGSHNPIEYNGLKIRLDGEPFLTEQIQELRHIIEVADFAESTSLGTLDQKEIEGSYLDYIRPKIHLARTLKVVVDAGNGTNGPVVSKLLRELGCDVVELYCEPDGNFPNHHPDPNEIQNMKDLMQLVQDVKADIGLAYDGDGDRLGVVDEKGRIVFADEYLVILIQKYLAEKKGRIIFDVRSSQSLIDVIEALGGIPIMSACGYPSITKNMRDKNGLLGGETTGHVFFNDKLINHDDAIFASCQLLDHLSKQTQSLSELLSIVPRYVSPPEIRIACPDDQKDAVVDGILSFFKGKHDIVDIDGVRIQFANGWALVRASNTQPALSMRFEALTENDLHEIKQTIKGKLADFSYLDLDF